MLPEVVGCIKWRSIALYNRLKYKIAALVSIVVASAIGVGTPHLGKVIPALSPEKDIFFFIKTFVADVITPDTFENLISPCLKEHLWGDFPFIGFVAMCTAIWTLIVDTYATAYFQKHHSTEIQSEHGMWRERQGTNIFTRMQRMTMLMLMALINPPSFFAIESYHRHGTWKLYISGKFQESICYRDGIVLCLDDSTSAGILIYMALVDLLATDFMNPRMQQSGRLRLGANISLLLGAGFMSLMAKWA
ncbi:hypothetical protein VNO80_04799 [Phaseolus coccineus]|uniref:Uncharacterized protein n=1 Tax=Phaseolus coccineus TaxID=3886 RepID=A0AAN9RNJ6_PHACN